jgi:putative transcriptional regulator
MTKFLTWLMIAAWLFPTAAGADQQLAKGKLLVASEFVVGEVFAKTVILILHYDETGAMGLVVNRPTEVEPGELLADVEAISGYSGTLYWGGPVQMNSLRALLRADTPPDGGQEVVDSVYQLPLDDALTDVPMDLASLRIFIGYAGWSAGQLDHELVRGDWLVVPASDELVFAEDPGLLWKRLTPVNEYRAAVN